MARPNGRRAVQILLVEDSPADVELTSEALSEAGTETNLHVVNDGEEALSFLHRSDGYDEAVRPDLIILDLNLPKKDGREVLTEVKQDPALKRIPVLVLTTSDAEIDIYDTYNLHANCYLTKPVDLDGFIDMFEALDRFWLRLVRFSS